MNAYPTCADWTDLDKEVERVSRQVMKDIDHMIGIRRVIRRTEMERPCLKYPYGITQQLVELNKIRLQRIINLENEYERLKEMQYPMCNLPSFRLQNYYQNHHVDPSIL